MQHKMGYYIKKPNPPLSRTSDFGDFYPSGMHKICVIDPSGRDLNPLWKCFFAF